MDVSGFGVQSAGNRLSVTGISTPPRFKIRSESCEPDDGTWRLPDHQTPQSSSKLCFGLLLKELAAHVPIPRLQAHRQVCRLAAAVRLNEA